MRKVEVIANIINVAFVFTACRPILYCLFFAVYILIANIVITCIVGMIVSSNMLQYDVVTLFANIKLAVKSIYNDDNRPSQID